MQNPTFHLDSVVKSKGGLDDFDGPLNLILMLLSKNKIEIRDIQISLILDQYLEFIRGMQELDLEVASEFVQMASHLTYIKTRMLLSGGEDVSELEQLMDSLEQLKCKDAYLKIKEVIPQFSKATEKGLMMFSARASLSRNTENTTSGTSRPSFSGLWPRCSHEAGAAR